MELFPTMKSLEFYEKFQDYRKTEYKKMNLRRSEKALFSGSDLICSNS
jgi:hypothetical protein